MRKTLWKMYAKLVILKIHIMRKKVEIVRTSTVYWTVNKVKL